MLGRQTKMKPLCYLCGGANATTKEHIPPRAFFPKPRPNNLITVLSCASCNNGFSQDDDYFRIIFASSYGRSKTGEGIWEERVVPKSLSRHPRDVDNILSESEDVMIDTEKGQEEIVSIQIDHNRLDRFCTRIVKGLIRYHYPDYDYYDSRFEVRLSPPLTNAEDHVAEIEPFFNSDERGDGVFTYKHCITDTGESGVWILTFYEAASILVYHTKLR